MPTINATRYTNYKKKFNREIQKQNGSTSSDMSSEPSKGLLAFSKNENFDNFKLPYLKPPSTLPVRPRRQISERREYTVNPFPKRASGHGIYQYENKYFRYEGQWRGGIKHGQGKLQMADGSYYEGTFTNGEIDGKGMRYFSQTGNKYTGQFCKGELHGRGMMVYADGSVYDGEWYKNRKHGYGVMKTLGMDSDEVYEGGYEGNMKHGVGVMMYANGDRYEGIWVNDIREGRGILYTIDGSVYEGDFKADNFNGRGKMHHSSGLIYDGQWVNGFPETMATKLKVTLNNNSEIDQKKKQPKDKTKVSIFQGIGFTVTVECRNESDRVIPDQGREIRLLAGFKYYPPVSNSEKEDALFDMIEDDAEEKPIETPFGYSVVPYPITDQINFNIEDLPDDEDQDDTSKSVNDPNQGPTVESEDEEFSEEKQENENKENEKEENTEENAEEKDDEDRGDESGNEETPDVEKENTVPQFPPLTTLRTRDGVCTFDDLHLTPAPPKYRPFERMEEAERLKTQSKSRSRSKELFTPSVSRQPSVSEFRDQPSRRRSSIRETPPHTSMFDKFRMKKQKAMEEKFAKLGEYVLIVQDVTEPPFMNRRLESDFLLMKLKQPPKEFKRETKKWDTSSHIKASSRVKEDELLAKRHLKV
ncbi:MORN repeat-containing protein 1-like isoform X2 [Saccostrea echinata]|uniref:MORN repeat-containing protein 1-like isoform X2 n=1 Tax=Saccostrea echinata TaxID=191078 RepID=UPI002A8238FA|nr:MORN repeat-containing protein 1-like isoform X2 [Saccostrea echinata]